MPAPKVSIENLMLRDFALAADAETVLAQIVHVLLYKFHVPKDRVRCLVEKEIANHEQENLFGSGNEIGFRRRKPSVG